MTVRLHREDLEKLLELVERYQLAAADTPAWAATSVLPPDRGIWLENRKFWEASLRAASDGDWSDAQYAEAADLLNAAEYQRIVFSEFADTLAQGVLSTGPHFPPSEPEAGTTFVESVSVINATTGEPEELTLRPTLSAVREAGLEPGYEHGPWGPWSRIGSLEDDPAALARLSERQIDLSSLTALRVRDGLPTALNVVRAELFAQTGVSALRPYNGWDDFKVRNDLPETLIDDLMAAYPDGFETVDLWVGGLAEQPVVGDLGPTLVALLHGELESIAPADLTALGLVQSGGLDHLIAARSASDIFADPLERLSDAAGLGEDDPAVLYGTGGSDVIRGSARPEVIYGGDGNDILFGGAGDDVIYGGAGDDYIDGGIGADLMKGGPGNDTYIVDDPGDVVVEAADDGIDTVKTTLTEYVLSDNVENLIALGNKPMFTGTGNAGNNLIKGSAEGQNILHGLDGHDYLYGGAGDDYLYGGAGDDYLDGGDGDNYLDGGAGNDTMRGSRRNDYGDDRDHVLSEGNELIVATRRSDTFVLREGFGHDMVIDFDANSSGSGGRDRIDVSAYLTFDKDSIGTDILISAIGSSTVVMIGADTLTLVGIDPREIDAGNFIFK